MTTIPSDPLFPYQWHLLNRNSATGTRGWDLNVIDVWDDYTGRGITVGVFEGGGVEYTHPDLSRNYDRSIDYNGVGNNGTPYPTNSDDNHPTAVAGVIGAVANNGIGGVGVAYDSTIASFQFGYGNHSSLTRAFQRLQTVDVANHSWGYTVPFADNFLNQAFSPIRQSIQNAVQSGRNGLGTAIVFAAGNNRAGGDNTNYHNFQNSRHLITVGAADRNGSITSYSTPGASILVSAFGSDPSSIVTTDLQGINGSHPSDYNPAFDGTSAAAPMVSGVVALMLEANPNLGYRDVQEILAYSARGNPNWEINGASNWNGGGLHVSHDFGFGIVDAHAAVRLAETWTAQNTFENSYYVSGRRNPQRVIPDNDARGISSSIQMQSGLEVETVEVDLRLTHSYRGDLRVKLISPDGTESVLVDRPSLGRDQGDNINFTLSSTHHWGEQSAGNWRLQVTDLAGGDIGVLNSWNLKLFGKQANNHDTYIYTNEFNEFNASTGRYTLNDTSGFDVINAAAVTSNSTLDLRAGKNGSLAGRSLAIGATTTIEAAFTGDGNDSIIGNAANNVLSAGRGHDFLAGGNGKDRLIGESGNDTIIGGNGNDVLAGGLGRDRLIGAAGNDFIAGGYGVDILTGGAGRDNFRFNALSERVDRITDYNSADDVFSIRRRGFGGALTIGRLTNSEFVLGSSARDSNDRFIYERGSGRLFFDPDGIGGVGQTQLAKLTNKAQVTANDFVII